MSKKEKTMHYLTSSLEDETIKIHNSLEDAIVENNHQPAGVALFEVPDQVLVVNITELEGLTYISEFLERRYPRKLLDITSNAS